MGTTQNTSHQLAPILTHPRIGSGTAPTHSVECSCGWSYLGYSDAEVENAVRRHTDEVFTEGTQVETIITAPHPAAFAGIIVATGQNQDGTPMARVRDASGVVRNYTTSSLRTV